MLEWFSMEPLGLGDKGLSLEDSPNLLVLQPQASSLHPSESVCTSEK